LSLISTPTQIINVDKKTAFRYPVVNCCRLTKASVITQVKKCSDRWRNGRVRHGAGNRERLDRARIQGTIPKQLG
jgi:hypothetical protein